MRLLLDPHVFLWVVEGSAKLNKVARQKISDADAAFISSAKIWRL